MTEERKNEIWAMLPADFKERLQNDWKDVCSKYNQNKNNVSVATHMIVLAGYFGAANLTAQAEEKPKEPRFKVGDKVKVMADSKPYQYGSIHTITELHADHEQCEYLLEKSNTMWFDERSLDPYTEPKVDGKISDKKGLLDRVIDAGYNFLDRHNPDVIPERGISNIDYTRYRLDLAREIALRLIGNCTILSKATIAYDCVSLANEIVKRLKETEI